MSTESKPPTFRAAQVTEAGGPFSVVERELVEPGPGHVRLTVEACGVCRSDEGFVDATFPGVSFPLVTGHEIAGRIDALGDGVEDWAVGDRVAVGWFGGHCGTCLACREGDFIHCARLQVPGWAYPGGYAEAVVVPASALARIPEGLTAVEAAPMGCAGVTTFNALRRSPAGPGDLVAVLGLGGLGHLGVQFAAKLGFETVSVARGAAKEEAAKNFGAHHYIDSTAGDVAAQLQALGGAKVVLATAASSSAMSATIDGLRHNGELVVIGATPEPIQVSPLQLIGASRSVHGHPSGTARDVEETLHFAALTGVRAMIETRPLDEVGAAYDRMMSGDARYRMVLTTGK
ncbi:alcohol dehydrogenase catalytic domain-containing protein [Nonomuraea phyllanthi]|uniref:Alcohol dehydrogenase n=1 Tax=Nonomuraea phyllanthi TaxID=2219224 RepID=A0A5C4W256_9ACTN|nr:alcohol dehydrogenase catalytic domain-containing protein [Nonomuraea phyllanthi]KAB8191618.1 alcohol dehydrogenase catalytic domain-containing protein [Nonomuraea phyllanthi]QFY13058.1 alcohol dehydrogenase catalytic domain-containing protein [Nonomuraea phyllanthi]